MQAYIRTTRAQGRVVNSSLAIAGAMGIIKKTNPAPLEANTELLSKNWVKSILFRISYIKPQLIVIALKIHKKHT